MGDMAPKRCYDAGRLGEAAEEAAKRAQAAHDDDVTLTCSYGGVVGGNELKKMAMVQFAWRAVAGEFNEEHTVHVRCDNACAKGVLVPGPLRAALRRRRLDQAAQQPDDEMWKSRLEEAGEAAAKRAQATHGDDVTFTCSYGGVEGGNELKKTAMVQFAWRAVAGEFNEERTVQVRRGNPVRKGSLGRNH